MLLFFSARLRRKRVRVISMTFDHTYGYCTNTKLEPKYEDFFFRFFLGACVFCLFVFFYRWKFVYYLVYVFNPRELCLVVFFTYLIYLWRFVYSTFLNHESCSFLLFFVCFVHTRESFCLPKLFNLSVYIPNMRFSQQLIKLY